PAKGLTPSKKQSLLIQMRLCGVRLKFSPISSVANCVKGYARILRRGISHGPFWYDELSIHLPGAVPQAQDLPRVVVSQLRGQRFLGQVLIADGARKTI